jgi:hypothetical protein
MTFDVRIEIEVTRESSTASRMRANLAMLRANLRQIPFLTAVLINVSQRYLRTSSLEVLSSSQVSSSTW